MTLSIKSFADVGDLQKERIVLKADEDVDIGEYVLLRSRLNDDGTVTPGSKSAYWFPDTQISKGDLVVVYTRTGVTSVKPLKNGGEAHFFYWHKGSTAWEKDKKNAAVLVYAPAWDISAPTYE